MSFRNQWLGDRRSFSDWLGAMRRQIRSEVDYRGFVGVNGNQIVMAPRHKIGGRELLGAIEIQILRDGSTRWKGMGRWRRLLIGGGIYILGNI
jgi:hypothetical protein